MRNAKRKTRQTIPTSHTETGRVLVMEKDDVIRGLLSNPKYLPDWYRYDKQGMLYFNRCLTENRNYYMYSSDIDILREHIQDMIDEVPRPTVLVDMGSGNCVKSCMFIDALLKNQSSVQFIPVDISKEFLLDSTEKISKLYGNKTNVQPLVEEYGTAIEYIRNIHGNKLILWLGGGFQNQAYRVQVERIERLAQVMSGYELIGKIKEKQSSSGQLWRFIIASGSNFTETDRLLISLDVTQSPERIKMAYHDDAGIMEDLYKNVFWRLNREYGSKIDTDKLNIEVDYVRNNASSFCSYVTVKAKANEQLSYEIPGFNITLNMKKGEYINLFDGEGTSCKYTLDQIQSIVQTGKQVLLKHWVDQKQHVAICCIGKN